MAENKKSTSTAAKKKLSSSVKTLFSKAFVCMKPKLQKQSSSVSSSFSTNQHHHHHHHHHHHSNAAAINTTEQGGGDVAVVVTKNKELVVNKEEEDSIYSDDDDDDDDDDYFSTHEELAEVINSETNTDIIGEEQKVLEDKNTSDANNQGFVNPFGKDKSNLNKKISCFFFHKRRSSSRVNKSH